jgi:hypothetical protein
MLNGDLVPGRLGRMGTAGLGEVHFPNKEILLGGGARVGR